MKISESWKNTPEKFSSLALPALAALAANFSKFNVSLPSISLLPDTVTIVLLPRVHVYSNVQDDNALGIVALTSPGPSLSSASLAGIIVGAILACLCCLLLAALIRRRRKQRKEEAKVVPVDNLSKDVSEEVSEVSEVEDEVSYIEPPLVKDFETPSIDSLIQRAKVVRDRARPKPGVSHRAPPATLAAAVAHSREAQKATEAMFVQRRERLKIHREAMEEHRKKEKFAELMKLPKHARILITDDRKDSRKWWSAPRVKPNESRLDRSKWLPLEKEKAAILAAGGVWPPPDPLLEALRTGHGRIINGQIVTVAAELSGESETELLARKRAIEMQRMQAKKLDAHNRVYQEEHAQLRGSAPYRPQTNIPGTPSTDPSKATLDSLANFSSNGEEDTLFSSNSSATSTAGADELRQEFFSDGVTDEREQTGEQFG